MRRHGRWCHRAKTAHLTIAHMCAATHVYRFVDDSPGVSTMLSLLWKLRMQRSAAADHGLGGDFHNKATPTGTCRFRTWTMNGA